MTQRKARSKEGVGQDQKAVSETQSAKSSPGPNKHAKLPTARQPVAPGAPGCCPGSAAQLGGREERETQSGTGGTCLCPPAAELSTPAKTIKPPEQQSEWTRTISKQLRQVRYPHLRQRPNEKVSKQTEHAMSTCGGRQERKLVSAVGEATQENSIDRTGKCETTSDLVHSLPITRTPPQSKNPGQKKPGAKHPSSAQPQDHPQRMSGAPNPREPHCPGLRASHKTLQRHPRAQSITKESSNCPAWSAPPQSVPRNSLGCPREAPRVQPRVPPKNLSAQNPWSAQPQYPQRIP